MNRELLSRAVQRNFSSMKHVVTLASAENFARCRGRFSPRFSRDFIFAVAFSLRERGRERRVARATSSSRSKDILRRILLRHGCSLDKRKKDLKPPIDVSLLPYNFRLQLLSVKNAEHRRWCANASFSWDRARTCVYPQHVLTTAVGSF